MDRLFFILKTVVDAMGIAIFTVLAIFAVIAGMLYQFFFRGGSDTTRDESPIIPPVPPPVTPQVEADATAAGNSAGMAPQEDSVDFFNKLGKS